jgi:hypothetical protein
VALIDPWQPVRQALVQRLRANLVLATSLTGDWSEGAAPPTTRYPLGVYSLVPSPSLYDWSGVVHDLLVDIVVFERDEGEAARLDQLVFTTLQDARLAFSVTGLTSLGCRRTGIITLQGVDDQGQAIFEVGGTWRIRVSQSNPASQTLSVTGDSTIG